MTIGKMTFLGVMCFHLFCISIYANSDDDLKWPIMFSGKISYIACNGDLRYCMKKIDDPNIYDDPTFYELSDWLGLEYNKDIARQITEIVFNATVEVRKKLNACEIFKDLYTENAAKRMNEMDIVFKYNLGSTGSTTGIAMSLSHVFLAGMLSKMGDQIRGQEWGQVFYVNLLYSLSNFIYFYRRENGDS